MADVGSVGTYPIPWSEVPAKRVPQSALGKAWSKFARNVERDLPYLLDALAVLGATPVLSGMAGAGEAGSVGGRLPQMSRMLGRSGGKTSAVRDVVRRALQGPLKNVTPTRYPIARAPEELGPQHWVRMLAESAKLKKLSYGNVQEFLRKQMIEDLTGRSTGDVVEKIRRNLW